MPRQAEDKHRENSKKKTKTAFAPTISARGSAGKSSSCTLQKRCSFLVESSLCLSRVCLGKMINIYMKKWDRTTGFLITGRAGLRPQRGTAPHPRELQTTRRDPEASGPRWPLGRSRDWQAPAENACLVFSTLSICLSRACLGKLIVLSIKMAQKRRFPLTKSSPSSSIANCTHAPASKRRSRTATWSVRQYDSGSAITSSWGRWRGSQRGKSSCSDFLSFPYVCPEPVLVK